MSVLDLDVFACLARTDFVATLMAVPTVLNRRVRPQMLVIPELPAATYGQPYAAGLLVGGSPAAISCAAIVLWASS